MKLTLATIALFCVALSADARPRQSCFDAPQTPQTPTKQQSIFVQSTLNCGCGSSGCPCQANNVNRVAQNPAPVPAVQIAPVVSSPQPQIILSPTASVAQPPIARSVQAGWHSHTCSAGHTWSHRDGDPNASHSCPICGRSQYVQDSHPVTQSFAQPVSYSAPVMTAGIEQFGGGCASGNCSSSSSASYSRSGLFGRRR